MTPHAFHRLAPTVSTATVVGAGVFGASTARELARRGWDVTLVEQYTPGHVRSASGGDTRLAPLRARRGRVVLAARRCAGSSCGASSRPRRGARLFEPVGVAWFEHRRLRLPRRQRGDDAPARRPLRAADAGGGAPPLPLARRRRPALRAVRARRRRDLRAAGDAGARARPARRDAARRRRPTRRAPTSSSGPAARGSPKLFPGAVELRVSRRDVFFLGVDGSWAGTPGFCDYDSAFYGHGDLGGLGMKVAPDRAGRPDRPGHARPHAAARERARPRASTRRAASPRSPARP